MNPLDICTKGLLSHCTSLTLCKNGLPIGRKCASVIILPLAKKSVRTFCIDEPNVFAQSSRFYTKLFLSLFLLFVLNIAPSSIQANDNIADPIITDLQTLNNRRAVEPPNISAGDIAKIFNCDAVSTIPKSECTALVELYEHTEGIDWAIGWDNTLEPCLWAGVTCQEGHVTILDLAEFGLVGALPAEIGDLAELTTLKLNQNKLTNVPPEIRKLSNLFWLGLQDNQLNQIPPEIGELTQITTLHLGGNQLAELPSEIGKLTNLERLNLKGNFLTSLPNEIGQLVSLIGVNIGYNQLTTLPEGFRNLQLLDSLEIDGNEWVDFPMALTDLENLSWLYISNGKLTSLPNEIAKMKSLKFIDASNNELKSIPVTFGQLPELKTFDFSNNLLSSIPTEIQDLPNLQSLNLTFNRLSEPIELSPQLGTDWKADQILPPDFRLTSQVNSQTFDGDASTLITYSVNIIWSPLLTEDSDGYYEIRYTTSLDGLDPTQDRYESVATPSPLNNNHVINDIQVGTTYFFQLYTHLPEVTDEDDIIIRKSRISDPSQIISVTVPSLQAVEQRIVDGTEPGGEQSIYINVRGDDFPADLSATLFINDVILNESPSSDNNGGFNLALDFSDIPTFLARYKTEIIFSHPNSRNRTYLSIKFDFQSDAIDDVSVALAEVTLPNNSIKVPPYVSSFLFIPYVSR